MYITKPGFPVQGQMSHNHHWTSCTPVMGGGASGVSEPLCVEPAAAQLWDPQPHWMVGCRGSSSTDGREAVRTSLPACHLFTPLPGSQNFPWPLSARLETFLHWSSQEARWGSSLGPRTDGLWSPPPLPLTLGFWQDAGTFWSLSVWSKTGWGWSGGVSPSSLSSLTSLDVIFQGRKSDQSSHQSTEGFPGDSSGKESACNAGDLDSIPGSGRSPGEGNGNPLQYSCYRIPWTEEPAGLQSMGLQRVRHDWTCMHVHSTEAKLHRTARLLVLP